MIELLLSWIWIGMEAVSLYCFGTAFFKRRLSLRCTLLVLLLYQSFMLIHANALLYKLPLIPEKLLGLLAVALAFAAAFSAPWYGCAAGAAGVFFFSTAVEILLVSLASALFGISMEDLVWKKAFYALFVTLEKSLEIFLCWGLMRLRNRKRNRGRSRRFALLVTLFPLISTFLILFIIQNYREQSDCAFPAVLFSVILEPLLQSSVMNRIEHKRGAIMHLNLNILKISIVDMMVQCPRLRIPFFHISNHLPLYRLFPHQ